MSRNEGPNLRSESRSSYSEMPGYGRSSSRSSYGPAKPSTGALLLGGISGLSILGLIIWGGWKLVAWIF
jgi:hypothetical protein